MCGNMLSVSGIMPPRDLKFTGVRNSDSPGLALRPSLPKVRVMAPANAGVGVQRNFQNAMNRTRWGNFRQTLRDRAAVALDEDSGQA